MQTWQCRWSPTLGALEDTHQEVWGTKDYENDTDPAIFFGLYGLPDFYALWRHKGERHILWAGSDIIHFRDGYWLEEGGRIRINPESLAEWISEHCTSWVENDVEYMELVKLGIFAKTQPSFLGSMNQFEVSFRPGNKVYTSVSGDNFELYGWDKIPQLAEDNPEIEFHLYGNIKEPYEFIPKNVVIHGRVPKEQMNVEIKEMQGALRLTEFDGFSEIIAKSILMGQWPVSLIRYRHVLTIDQLCELPHKKEPNLEGREYYRRSLNQYPWNQKSQS